MAIFLEQLYTETKNLYQLELLSDTSGLQNIVNWVYITEDIVSSDFLSGNELVITTGISVSENPSWLKEFIQVLIRCHASGVIVNIGKYLFYEDITKDILDLCNQHHFPLMVMPWETRIIHITKDYYHRIFEDTRSYENTLALFHKALQGYELSSLELTSLKEEHFTTNNFCISCMEITPKDATESFSLEESFSFFYPFLLHQLSAAKKKTSQILNYHLSLFERQILMIFNVTDSSSLETCLSNLTAKTCVAFPKYQIGVSLSDTVSSVLQLQTAYFQARASLLMAKTNQQNFYAYKDLGFIKILLDVKHTDILSDYVTDHLQPLITYDEKHHANLLETLSLYFKYHGSLQRIAQAMFCHRNTVSYRLGLIKKLLSSSLSEEEQNFQLSTALFIYDYLKIFHDFLSKQ